MLEDLLDAGDLINTVSGDGPYTVMVPWNRAIERFESRLGSDVPLRDTKWIAHLQNLLLGHVILDNVMVDDLEATQMMAVANGEMVEVKRRPGTSRVHVNGILVLATYDASNGFVYMLNKVIVPKWNDITVQQVATSHASMFASLAETAGIQATLRKPGTTIFAPDNAAFDQVDKTIMDTLKTPEGKEALLELLNYHMVQGGPHSSLTVGTGPIQTLQGGDMTVTVSGDTITVSLSVRPDVVATVTTADLLAQNGLIHVIDKVLLP